MRKVSYRHFDALNRIWETEEGVFHQWGVTSERVSDGVESNTIAIVELKDGKVVEVLPRFLKFLSGTPVELMDTVES